MKALTYLLTGILIFLSVPGQAQIKKGDWMLGGNGSLSMSFNGATSLHFIVSPNAGLFLNDRLVVGLQPTLGFSEIYGGQRKGSQNIFGIKGFGRWYFLKYAEGKGNVFLEASGGINQILSRSKPKYGPRDSSSYSDQEFSGAVGLSYFITPSVAFEITLDYSHWEDSGWFSSTISGFNMNLGFQIFLQPSSRKKG